MTDIWTKGNYKSKYQYIVDHPIREYDISKANINVLRDANAISEETYQYLYAAPKLDREVFIGKMQGRDSNITSILKDGIANARRIFIEANQITDDEILAIRNDAITVIGDKPIRQLQITDRVAFRLAGLYSSYYSVERIDYFYNCDRIKGLESLEVKGLGDGGQHLHEQYMLSFLMRLFYTAQIEGAKNAINILQSFYYNYINKNLDIQYYRELNSQSMFRYISNFSMVSTLYTEFASEYDKNIIDISYNENILRQFMRILASLYFAKR